MAGIGNRWLAILAVKDVVRQLCDVLPGHVARNLSFEARLDEAPQVAGDVGPAFDPGTLLAVVLYFVLLHSVDAQFDDLCNDLALLCLDGLGLAQLFDQRRRVEGLERITLLRASSMVKVSGL